MCIKISALLIVSQGFACGSLSYDLLSVHHVTSRIIIRLNNSWLAQRINQIINILIILSLPSSIVLCIKALVKHCITLDVALGLSLNSICHISINLLFIVTVWATSLDLPTIFIVWWEVICKLLFCTWRCQSWSKVSSTTTDKKNYIVMNLELF